MKTILIVLDSVGIGAAPDAGDYGDAGSATLQHTAAACGGLSLPTLEKLGLGNIPALLPDTGAIQGVTASPAPQARFGAMQEISVGKDTITGHWEIGGLEINPGFHLFPETSPAFPAEITETFIKQTGRPILGNRHGSGTAIVDEMGAQALAQKAFIVYTSADSVFQIAAHTDAIPLEELYHACEIARALCDPYRVGRVIARPFNGSPGSFTRTRDRRDYAYQPDEPTILERLHNAGVPVYAVGKIEDIFAHRGITESWHTGDNATSMDRVTRLTEERPEGFIFANYIDFDMRYGHRRDAAGYGKCLEETDRWLAAYLPRLASEDTLILTADHGNDPTFKGTDHTREYVPLLVYRPGQPGGSLGIRRGFYDIAQSLAARYGIDALLRGVSFLDR